MARLSIDVSPEERRRIKLAAAKRDLTIRDYVLGAVAQRLRQDGAQQRGSALSGRADPVLNALWNNRRDAIYDSD